MKTFRSQKGSFTVEMTILFIVVFASLIFFLFVGVVMYQHVHLQSATDRIASRGAMIFATRTTDMNAGHKSTESFWNCDPYRYILDGISSYKVQVEENMEGKLSEALGIENIITANDKKKPDADVKLGMFVRKVEVVGNRSFNVPFSSLFDTENSFFDLDVKSTAYITDMPETIRNVDYAVDMLKRSEGVSTAIEKVGELKVKLESFIQKIEN